MAIRMKEWGMLAAPGQSVNLPTQGLTGWGQVAREMGSGLASVVAAGAEVCRMGELAAFSERLKDIRSEVDSELKDQPVQDWNYSWNTAAAPRIAEAVQELSAGSRERGAELARAYSARASIEVQRDRELQRVEDARSQWQQRVEEAVNAGQPEQAARWLEAGRGVFVPEQEMERRQEELQSRACLSRWESRLQAAPLQTLSELAEAQGAPGHELPARAEEGRGLELSCERARKGLRRELAQGFSESLRAGDEPDAATVELATKAGVLPPLPHVLAPATAAGRQQTPSFGARSAWRRWVDERADGDEGELQSRLSIATAPLPLEERRSLLDRLERSTQVPAADRRTLSNRLFSLYNSGAFGCPGDAEAQRALISLQDEGASLLAEQGAEAASDWVTARQGSGEHWVCYEAPGEPTSTAQPQKADLMK